MVTLAGKDSHPMVCRLVTRDLTTTALTTASSRCQHRRMVRTDSRHPLRIQCRIRMQRMLLLLHLRQHQQFQALVSDVDSHNSVNYKRAVILTCIPTPVVHLITTWPLTFWPVHGECMPKDCHVLYVYQVLILQAVFLSEHRHTLIQTWQTLLQMQLIIISMLQLLMVWAGNKSRPMKQLTSVVISIAAFR